MHIVVALRLVPDLTGDTELSADGKDIDREWIDIKLNEFDDHALEEALLLQETAGAEVTAVAINQDGADRQLQTALARGANKAFKINAQDGVPLSSRATAALFSAAAKQLQADLFVTGVQTPEDITGQLASIVGALLDWPCVNAVSSIAASGAGIVAEQEYSGGHSATFEVQLPAVCGVQTASQPIRYVSGSKLRQAAGSSIHVLNVIANKYEENVDRISLAVPDRNGGAKMLGSNPQNVADQLRQLLADNKLLKG